jgi:hypothetical protein
MSSFDFLVVFTDTRETMETSLDKAKKKAEGKTDKKLPPGFTPKPVAKWEYKIEDKVFGPYTTKEMLEWREGVRLVFKSFF